MKRATLIIGVILVGLVLLLAAVSLVWTPYPPDAVNTANRLQPPSAEHLLGTDGFGADTLSRIMVGARVVLQVGVFAVGLAMICGVPLGMVAGMSKGAMSTILQRSNDILFAFPALLLAILLAAIRGSSLMTASVAIGVATIPIFVRLTRAGTLQVMSREYVMAARAAGIRRSGIAVRHVLPNIAPLIGVQASMSMGLAILAEAALSYLGLSAPPETPTWGRMLSDAQRLIFSNPELLLWPGVAIAISVLGFNVLGDGLRDYLDPTLRDIS